MSVVNDYGERRAPGSKQSIQDLSDDPSCDSYRPFRGGLRKPQGIADNGEWDPTRDVGVGVGAPTGEAAMRQAAEKFGLVFHVFH